MTGKKEGHCKEMKRIQDTPPTTSTNDIKRTDYH